MVWNFTKWKKSLKFKLKFIKFSFKSKSIVREWEYLFPWACYPLRTLFQVTIANGFGFCPGITFDISVTALHGTSFSSCPTSYWTLWNKKFLFIRPIRPRSMQLDRTMTSLCELTCVRTSWRESVRRKPSGPENMNSYCASKLKKKIAFSMNCKFLILKQRKKGKRFNKNILCSYPAHALLMYFNASFLDSNINSYGYLRPNFFPWIPPACLISTYNLAHGQVYMLRNCARGITYTAPVPCHPCRTRSYVAGLFSRRSLFLVTSEA